MTFPTPLDELSYLTGRLTRLLLEHGADLQGQRDIAYLGTQGAKTIHLYVDSDMLDMHVTDGNITGLSAFAEYYDEG